jgi:anti-anti-sigma factor
MNFEESFALMNSSVIDAEVQGMAVKAMTLNNLDIAILELRGSFLGGEETDELKANADDLFEQGNRKLILDLANVAYCNSLGIGALINIHTTYSNGRGRIKICGMGKGIENVFVITKLMSVFDVEDSLDEAIQKFQARSLQDSNSTK